MRRKYLGLGAAVLLTLFLLLAPVTQIHAVEEANDFDDDDGVVEDVSDDNSETGSQAAEEIVYESPQFDPKDFFFVDHFDNIEESSKRWIKSQAKKDDIAEEIAKYDGEWKWESPQRIVSNKDIGLVLKSKAKHAAIAAKLHKEFDFQGQKPLVVQYEVTMQEGQECGGSYIKLLSSGKHTQDLTKFNDKTPYTIMFGPDKCGNDVKLHFIFRHVNPINGSVTEKHCRKPKDRLEEPFKDKLPHLYQLVVKPDNSFEIRVDHKIVNEGSLLTEFAPPVNPPREIDDPNDIKPVNWDEREKIPDPTAEKPDDWDEDAPPQIPDPNAIKPDGWLDDEPEMISDPTATKPDDWDAEIDGDWEAPLVDNPVCEKAAGCGLWKTPLIPNPEFKGKWRAPMIDNPNYQGKWAPRKIPNPDFFEDLFPFRMTPISAIGIELWSMSNEILFDNLIITDDLLVAKDFAANSFDIKRKYIDQESESFFNKIVAYGKENPWSWRIAIVLLGTPLVFTVYRLFSKGGSQDAAEQSAKKTDGDDASSPVEDGAGDAESKGKSSPKSKKSDSDKEDEGAAAGGGTDGDSDEPDAVENKAETEEVTTKSVRKRRVRKDQS